MTGANLWRTRRAPRETRLRRAAYRAQLARTQIPPTLLLAAVVMLVLGVVYRLQSNDTSTWAGSSFLSAAIVMAAFGLVARRLPPRVMVWTYGVAMALILGPFLIRSSITGLPELIGLSAVLALTLTSLALSWKPVLLGWALLTVLDLIVQSTTTVARPDSGMVVVTAAAMLFGAGLLAVRIRTVNLLADSATEVEHMASHDQLTGVFNRHGFDLALPVLVGAAQRASSPIVVAFVDIDGLKAVNDTLGHAEGDRLIEAVAASLRATTRSGDLIARVGGDEFVIAGTGTSGDLESLRDRITQSLATHFPDGDGNRCTISMGTASGDPRQTTVAELLAAADRQLYERRREVRGT